MVNADQTTDSRKPLISIRNVSLSYGNFQALSDVSVDFYQGEMVGLVGDNGAGKTTLIRIISGIIPPTAGEVYFDGERITKFHPKKAIDLGLECIQQTIGICDTYPLDVTISLGGNRPSASSACRFLTRKRSEKPAQRWSMTSGCGILLTWMTRSRSSPGRKANL
jgi:ABC-type sugar transport system ATPase subunit